MPFVPDAPGGPPETKTQLAPAPTPNQVCCMLRGGQVIYNSGDVFGCSERSSPADNCGYPMREAAKVVPPSQKSSTVTGISLLPTPLVNCYAGIKAF